MAQSRFIGIDTGAETLKVVEVIHGDTGLQVGRRTRVDHDKEPARALRRVLEEWGVTRVAGAAITGRLARGLCGAPGGPGPVPLRQAQAAGFRFLVPQGAPATLVSIGSHGFSVQEMRASGVEVFRENSRCSQGTGNFLRQLVERFDLSIEEASALCADVPDPTHLSGRCPVILKTDMTHLANTGHDRLRVLAGLFDAVASNVQVLVKPRTSPPRVALLGGVAQSPRVRAHFQRFLAEHGMQLLELGPQDGLFVEATGCALLAAEAPQAVDLSAPLVPAASDGRLERIGPLSAALDRVRRIPAPPLPSPDDRPRTLILGLDIGSTGAKAVALDLESQEMVWHAYTQTLGDPLRASQVLVRSYVEGPWRPVAGIRQVVGWGVTGSGRQIVGSLLTSCFGPGAVHVLNEIAAHARGAVHCDPRVDTIFEIGGQDAKYIRLSDGRVVDAAMNEACSAGTGSFIEEQGRRLTLQALGDRSASTSRVEDLGQRALAAPFGVSLGQHCSVFMAEVMDEAIGQGIPPFAVIAGIYDSVVQNYLNRVKGSRTLGQVLFCQGMPFSADALAAAVARQTGCQVVVPPHPGLMGALGIALLAREAVAARDRSPLDPAQYLSARVERRETFRCRSTAGCGGGGNACRIDRIHTRIGEVGGVFTWGGACSLYDRGMGRRRLPDRAPDPFREREERVAALIQDLSTPAGVHAGSPPRPRVGITDEFMLKGLFPFFARFLRELGLDLVVRSLGDHGTLQRGIEASNVPTCAPLQMFHGLVSDLVQAGVDWVFAPMIRSLAPVKDEPFSVTCPMVQASPDMVRLDLGLSFQAGGNGPRLLSPVVDVGFGYLRSEGVRRACADMARTVGAGEWERAWEEGILEQARFDAFCGDLGRRALEFARSRDLLAVVVLGRPYTYYNRVLNSNVPAILRELGAMAIPVDCTPVDPGVPVFDRAYWGYGQRSLRAAHQVRRTPGLYSLWTSNYACGPDSFCLHSYAFLMEGRPYAVIETDGHAGDAGTRTRVEAFLHCAEEDRRRTAPESQPPRSLVRIEQARAELQDVLERQELALFPRMGPGAESLAAALRGSGMRAEALPLPDREALGLGRRHTSGKECIPAAITLGSLLQRLEREPDPSVRFAFFMPQANGPCRFGSYNVLHKIVLERLDLHRRVRVWSPTDNGYFKGAPAGMGALVFSGIMAMDLLTEALYDTRPVEREPGRAQDLFQKLGRELCDLLEDRGGGDLSAATTLIQVTSGRLFGVRDLLARAGRAFAALKGDREIPTVLVVGEIYVRCDPFANGFLIEELERRGIRSRFAPVNEWLEYVDHLFRSLGYQRSPLQKLTSHLQDHIRKVTYRTMAAPMGWPARTSEAMSQEAASSYLRPDLRGEAVLTIGAPIHEWRAGLIDGAVSVSPLECMPGKIAEAQLFHAAEREGLPCLCLSVNGEPLDADLLDNFAFEVKRRYQAQERRVEGHRIGGGTFAVRPSPPGQGRQDAAK